MQSDMSSTMTWTKSKLEVEFQYGRPLFFQTGNSYISALDSVIATKYGLPAHTGLLKRDGSQSETGSETAPSDRHLEN